MKPSSSPADTRVGPDVDALFGPIFGADRIDREVDGRAWLRAMLDAERALAQAGARVGVVPVAAAEAIAAACAAGAERFDPTELGRRARDTASPVIPLVRDLTATVPESARPFVHLGATSQDIIDTAAALIARRALDPILVDLAATADAAAGLAGTHRETIMAGRSLLQQAVPVTFGLRCAGWLVALDEAVDALTEVRDARLAAQLGGAAGTLAPLGPRGVEVAREFAAGLDLAEPVLPWHADRTRPAALAGALGVTAGVLAKIAKDVLLLAQTEVAEVAEPAPTGGGSSAMPHKQNPVRAIVITANTRRVPALVATVLAGMDQEHERAAGAWQAEWETLTALLRLVGGAAERAGELVAGLRVDAARMRSNLDGSLGLPMAASVADRLSPALGRTAAHDVVAAAAAQAVRDGRPLRAVLADDPRVRAHLSGGDLDAALDPAGYLGATGEFIDRALAAHRARPGRRVPAGSGSPPPGDAP